MKLKINSALRCGLNEKELIITVPNQEILSIDEGNDLVLKILKEYLNENDYDIVFENINDESYISRSEYKDIIEMLVDNNILKKCENIKTNLSDYHKEKYSRQISSLNSLMNISLEKAMNLQQNINNSKVCIVGLGGTGSYLAISLACISVEEMILVDFDTIDLSNTSRQVLYTENDLGKNKLEVAKEKLKLYNSKLNIITYNINIKELKDLSFLKEHKDIDLLVLCADTPRGEIQYIIDDACNELDIPWFCYGPFHHYKVMIGPFIIPKVTKTYRELFPKETILQNKFTEKINDNFVASVCDPYNGFASQFAAIECFKILSKVRPTELINKRFYINTDDWSLEKISYE